MELDSMKVGDSALICLENGKWVKSPILSIRGSPTVVRVEADPEYLIWAHQVYTFTEERWAKIPKERRLICGSED